MTEIKFTERQLKYTSEIMIETRFIIDAEILAVITGAEGVNGHNLHMAYKVYVQKNDLFTIEEVIANINKALHIYFEEKLALYSRLFRYFENQQIRV